MCVCLCSMCVCERVIIMCAGVINQLAKIRQENKIRKLKERKKEMVKQACWECFDPFLIHLCTKLRR